MVIHDCRARNVELCSAMMRSGPFFDGFTDILVNF